jgi:glycosyltransferase involved in cell wall biosynthesis
MDAIDRNEMARQQDQMRFSVVVPAYNESAYLGSALDSLLAQDFEGRYEIIVVDNNSTDDTAAVAACHGVRVVHEVERGVCAARQRGSAIATGDIIVSTDADTVQPTDWLRTIDARFASEQVVAVAGPCRYQNPSWWAKAYPPLLFGSVAAVFALTGYVFYVTATNLAVRRSAFPGYDLKQTQGGDELDLLRRLRPRGRVIWDRHNVVNTSPRRLQRGLIYTIFVSFFVYYFLAYVLNRVSAHRTLGTAPAIRYPRIARAALRRPVGRPRRSALLAIIVGLTVISLLTGAGPAAFASLSGFWTSL